MNCCPDAQLDQSDLERTARGASFTKQESRTLVPSFRVKSTFGLDRSRHCTFRNYR